MPEVSVRNQIIVIKAGVVYDKRLLILTSATPSHGTTRDLPGGKLRHGEDPLSALRREVLEETGISIIPVSPVRIWSFLEGEDTQFVGITFACRSMSSDVCLSAEHVSYQWLSREEIPLAWPESAELLAVLDSVEKGASPVAGTSAATW